MTSKTEHSQLNLSLDELRLTDLIDVEELQKMQDIFSDATGVAAIITDPSGEPITRPSNFCRLCSLIRNTTRGKANCIRSDAIIGKKNPLGPIMQPCLSGGLLDGGASISLGNRHIANWLIGQVRKADMDIETMVDYAHFIGVDEGLFREAFAEVPVMSVDRFEKICQALFLFANHISRLAYQNLALRQSEYNLQNTLNSIGDAVVSTDSVGIIARMNPIAEKLTGWSQNEAIGFPLENVFQAILATDRAAVDRESCESFSMDRVMKKQEVDEHALLVNRDGREYHIVINATQIRNPEQDTTGVVVVFRDETERFILEEQLRHSQKMEAIGQLAGGVAHDFNNILSGILGAAELLSNRLQDDPRNRQMAHLIIDATERAASLTRKLLDFSRKGQQECAPLDVHRIIQNVIAICEHSFDKKIKISSDLNANSCVVNGDAAQLQNALLNLCLNSRDAMPDGGSLRLATVNVLLEEKDCWILADEIMPGFYVEISVCDSGFGIPPQIQQRIFEPFFTTKGQGKGTGLGLAAVYGMLKKHNGAIHVYSEEGNGTIFKIYLPTSKDPVVPMLGNENDSVVSVEGLRVLVVDDESIVLSTAELILQELGCQVSTAANGTRAVEILKNDTFDLIILDVIMPEMNGSETLAVIRNLPCNTPVVFASGFTFNESIKQLKEYPGIVGFVQKPYRTTALLEILKKSVRQDGE